jgi:hypothetical protein
LQCKERKKRIGLVGATLCGCPSDVLREARWLGHEFGL